MPRAKPRCFRVCRACPMKAQPGSRFCSDACEELYRRNEEEIGDRETVQMGDEVRRVWLHEGTQRANLQNSA